MPIILTGDPPTTGGSNSPLTTHQQVVAGDDYKAEDGRALSWTSAVFPDLAGSTLTMTVGHVTQNIYGNMPAFWTGTVPASPDAPQTITLDVTALQTSALPADEYDYTLTATLLDGDKWTVAIGALTVQASPTAVPTYDPAV